jgi:EAL domain-containing protein (putative c-di-GMP-specific phosphodiesterase class I)
VTAELRRKGVSVVVDDFGTGYSSLSYLRTFPLDGVKIDQSFVRGITTNAIDRQIVESVIGLARAIGLGTVAEGVETQEQFDLLKGMGCDIAQGYLIAKPLVLDDLMKFIRS